MPSTEENIKQFHQIISDFYAHHKNNLEKCVNNISSSGVDFVPQQLNYYNFDVHRALAIAGQYMNNSCYNNVNSSKLLQQSALQVRQTSCWGNYNLGLCQPKSEPFSNAVTNQMMSQCNSTSINPANGMQIPYNGNTIDTKKHKTQSSTSKRMARTKYSLAQLHLLKRTFSESPTPTPLAMKTLARTLNLHYRKVKTWFHNRRSKYRKLQKFSSSESSSSSN